MSEELDELDKKALWSPIPIPPSVRSAPRRAVVPASRIRLYVQTYDSGRADRQKELDYCLRKNKALPFLEVVELPAQDRLSFAAFFALAREQSDDDTISVFANSDIRFDNTLRLARWMCVGDAWALTRWRSTHFWLDGHAPNGGHQELGADVWAFRGRLRQIPDCDFGMGMAFCDYSIAARIRQAGYKLRNPCWSVRTWHHHASDLRTYDNTARTPAPWVYMIPPGSLTGWLDEGLRGLGDVVAAVTSAVGIQPCGGCKGRQEGLNKAVPFK